MHVYFSGIGGTGIGPLALIANDAGYNVSGSDKQPSQYIDSLISKGITDIHIGQGYDDIVAVHERHPIDWFVYSSALSAEDSNHPELRFVQEFGIKSTKRDDFLNFVLKEKNQKLIAIAGTHGKTTTTAMTIWLLESLGMSLSYSLGAKIENKPMGHLNPDSEYFVYEADEYDRNFLSYKPSICMISGIDYDHPDTYPTRQEYESAFVQFLRQCSEAIMWESDVTTLKMIINKFMTVVTESDPGFSQLTHIGLVNRRNAWLAVRIAQKLTGRSQEEIISAANKFPGLSRRFERISDNIYSDYAHTPGKIKGALQAANESSPGKVVVVYEGLHNTRQHFIKDELPTMFEGAMKLVVVPSYRARENESLEDLTPEKLCNIIDHPSEATPEILGHSLKKIITKHVNNGDLVLCLSAGGGDSLDEWLRKEFNQK